MLTTSTLITNLITENIDVINKYTNVIINEKSCYCNNNIKIYPSEDFVVFRSKYNTTAKLERYIATAITKRNTELIDINDIALSTQKAKKEHFESESSESYRFLSFHSPNSTTNTMRTLSDNIFKELNEHETKSLITLKTAIFKGVYYSQFHIDENNYGNLNYMPTFCYGCCKLWFFLEDYSQRSKKLLFKNLKQFKHDKHGELQYIMKNINKFLVIKQVPGMVLEFLPGGFPHAVLTFFETNHNPEEITVQVALITATERAFRGNITQPTFFGRRMKFEEATLNYNEWKSKKIDELLSLKSKGNFLFISEFSE